MAEENIVRRLANPTPADILSAFRFEEDVVEHWWRSYLEGNIVALEPYPEPLLHVVPASDLQLTVSPRDGGDEGDRVIVERESVLFARNFMGYSPRKRCYGFNGEMRLLRQFLDLVGEFFRTGRVETALVRPRGIYAPLDGLNAGFSYDEFEAKIKLCDVVLFIRDGSEILQAASGAVTHPPVPMAAARAAATAARISGPLTAQPNGAGVLASTASIVEDTVNTAAPAQDGFPHWRYSFRQRNRAAGSSGASGATGRRR